MSSSKRLDVYLGDLRAELDVVAQTTGRTAGDVMREAYLLWRLSQSGTVDAVRNATLDCIAALQPDGRHDPEDDTRIEAPIQALAQALGSYYAALGVVEALRQQIDTALLDIR